MKTLETVGAVIGGLDVPDSGRGKVVSRMAKWLALLVACCGLLQPGTGKALGLLDDDGTLLGYWSFSDTTNWVSDFGYAPVSFTNLSFSTIEFGYDNCLLLDSTNAPAWLQYNVYEQDGWTNLTVDNGSLMFWFAPASWSSTNVDGGTGPGQWGRLIEVGSYTSNASYGWWSLYLDDVGCNLYFSAQDNDGSETNYLSAPVVLTNGLWHQVALVYTPTNSALFLDGQLLTNGPGVSIYPGPDVLSNGFWIGSDSNGVAQARGLFDDLHTYNFALDGDRIQMMYDLFFPIYNGYLEEVEQSNIAPAPSNPGPGTSVDLITGPGVLVPLATNTLDCVSSSNVWLANVVATVTNNGTMNLVFTISGGSDGSAYDVFATAALAGSGTGWAWMGQGYHCVTYMLTNLPSSAAFLVLGTTQDSDNDGLTDAFEALVSKSNPLISDTNGDGIPDGLSVIYGIDPAAQVKFGVWLATPSGFSGIP